MKYVIVLLATVFCLLQGPGLASAADDKPCVGANDVPCPTVTVMVPTDDPGHYGDLVDISPSDANEKATATTFTVIGVAAGALIAIGLLSYVSKKSREKGSEETTKELLTVLKETNSEDTQPMPRTELPSVKRPGKHRAPN